MTMGALGGVTALVSHAAKSGVRLAVNTSPEPLSNIGASLAGDAALVTVIALAIAYPVQAAILAGILLIGTIALAVMLLTQIRRGVTAFRAWLAAR
jgi:hypothetical protein